MMDISHLILPMMGGSIPQPPLGIPGLGLCGDLLILLVLVACPLAILIFPRIIALLPTANKSVTQLYGRTFGPEDKIGAVLGRKGRTLVLAVGIVDIALGLALIATFFWQGRPEFLQNAMYLIWYGAAEMAALVNLLVKIGDITVCTLALVICGPIVGGISIIILSRMLAIDKKTKR